MLADAARAYLHRYGSAGRTRVRDRHVGRQRLRRSGRTAHGRVSVAVIADRATIVRTATRGGARVGHADACRRAAWPAPRVAARRPGHPVQRRDAFPATCADVRRLDAVGASVFAVARETAVRRRVGAFLPGESAGAGRRAGACAGTFDLACVRRGGPCRRSGARTRRSVAVDARQRLARTACPGRAAGKAFVDFQNDVTTKDLAVATSEGFRSIEHVKRYTTAGMATDQGKTANLNALATVAR